MKGVELSMAKYTNLFVLGDGAITPAISVLSAVEGITTTSESLTKWILPITVIIIIALFFVQMFGTSKIGRRKRLIYMS